MRIDQFDRAARILAASERYRAIHLADCLACIEAGNEWDAARHAHYLAHEVGYAQWVEARMRGRRQLARMSSRPPQSWECGRREPGQVIT